MPGYKYKKLRKLVNSTIKLKKLMKSMDDNEDYIISQMINELFGQEKKNELYLQLNKKADACYRILHNSDRFEHK